MLTGFMSAIARTSVGFRDDEVEVIIVGGGPCGLALTAQINALRDTKIAIVEKYPEFQRKHILKVERGSFKNFPQSLRGLVDRLWNGSRGSSKNISTSTIEECFKTAISENNNTQFYYGEERDIRSLRERFPNARVIVGADGSHSLTSKQIFAENFTITEEELVHLQEKFQTTRELLEDILRRKNIEIIRGSITERQRTLIDNNTDVLKAVEECCLEKRHFRKTHQYVAELKFETTQDVDNMNFFSGTYPLQKAAGCIFMEYVGRRTDEETGETKSVVTCRFFISESTYQSMEGRVTFKKPMDIRIQEDIPVELRHAVNIYLNAKQASQIEGKTLNFYNDHPIDMSKINAKLTVTSLESYYRSTFVKEEDGVTYALVGDAATGVPFFRSFNNGLLLTSKLATTIAQSLNNPENRRQSFLSYNRYTKIRACWEVFKAYLKSFLLDVYKWWVHISSWVPWQINIIHPEIIEPMRDSPFAQTPTLV